MVKHLFLVGLGCLAALLVASCGDGRTESAVNQSSNSENNDSSVVLQGSVTTDQSISSNVVGSSIDAAEEAAAKKLKVKSPNGGEALTKGESILIKWDKGNGGKFIKILLLKSNKAYKWVSKKTKNDGSHRWKIPNSLTTGSAYTIKLISATNKKIFDVSDDTFSIEAADDGTWIDAPDDFLGTVSLSCTPTSASENSGKFTCTLSLSAATTKRVTIKVAYSGTATAGTDYRGSKTTHRIAAGKTSTRWTITGIGDDEAEEDETIVVDISSVANATEDDISQVSLTLVDADAKVTSPTKGDKWLVGVPHNIQWTMDGSNFKFNKINLKKGTKPGTRISSIDNWGTYGDHIWTPQCSRADGDDYYIEIEDYYKPSLQITSDYFSLYGGTPGWPINDFSCH